MATDDFFRARRQSMIDPLPVLAAKQPWPGIEAALSLKSSREDRAPGSETVDGLFGTETIESGGGISSPTIRRIGSRGRSARLTPPPNSTVWAPDRPATTSVLGARS